MSDSFFTSTKPRKRKRSTSDRGYSEAKASKKGPREGLSKPKNKPTTIAGHTKTPSTQTNGAGKRRKKPADEEIGSDRTDEEDEGVDDMDLRADYEGVEEDSGEEDESESPAEKRLRLAQLYLDSVKEGLADGEFDAADIDKELISARLRQDVMEHSGKVHLLIANQFDFSKPPSKTLYTRGHRFSVTSAVACESCAWLFTAGKEGSIFKWNLFDGRKVSVFHKIRPESGPSNRKDGKRKGKEKANRDVGLRGHSDEVLALALSDDNKYLASGGKDNRVCVWDVEKGAWVKGFLDHRDSISTLAFRKGSLQLFSGSFDRTLKLFDLSVMGYVETLFGHQDTVLALDVLRAETAVSVGGRDKTVRFWKILDETQLVFRGGGRSAVRDLLDGGALEGLDETVEADNERGKPQERHLKSRKFVEGSLECVAMLDESTFVSGGDSGSICLWNTQKKKPIFTHALAHGFHEVQSETEGVIKTPRWVTALASLRYSDIFASGSWEGVLRLWKLDPKLKFFSHLNTIPVLGFVNSLQFISTPPDFLTKVSWSEKMNQTKDPARNPLPRGTAAPDASTQQRPSALRVDPIMVIAGMGQEHRLGRWMKLKEGVFNGAFVAVFPPQKRTT